MTTSSTATDPAADAALASACLSLLQQECLFLSKLADLLRQMRGATLFEAEVALGIERELSRMVRVRGQLDDLRGTLRRRLQERTACDPSDVRLSLLDAFLPPDARDGFRALRRKVFQLAAGMSPDIRRTEAHLAQQAGAAADLLSVLTGTSSTPARYNADGRQQCDSANGFLRACS